MKRILLLILLICTNTYFAQTTYTSTTTGNWSTMTWSPVGTPGVSDNVVIANGHNVTLDGNVTLSSLVINSGGTMTISASRTLNGTITVNGSLAISGATTTLTCDNNISCSGISASIIFSSNGAKISNTGSGKTISLNNGGTIELVSLNSSPLAQIFTNMTWSVDNSSNNTNIVFRPGGSYTITPIPNNQTYGNLSLRIATASVTGDRTGTFSSNITLNGNLDFQSNPNGSYQLNIDLAGYTIIGNGSSSSLTVSVCKNALNVTCSGTNSFSNFNAISFIPASGSGTVTVNYTSASSQNIGTGSYYNLTTSSGGAKSLVGNISLSNTLTLTSGLLVLGSYSISLGNSATILGTPSASNMIVATGSGYLTKGFSGAGSFIYPVGDNTGTVEYSPVTLNFTSGTFSSATASINLTNSKHSSNTSSTNYLTRYWTIASSGITSFSCDVTCTYVDGDVYGTEASIYLGRYSSGAWTLYSAATTATNQLTGTVSGFGDFTGGEQSALPVELTSFDSYVDGNKVNLFWSTATEVNNYGFDVERALFDGHSLSLDWKKIGFVQGNGNSNSNKNYSFTDEPTGGKEFLYRLKQIDLDGQFEYSNEITVVLKNVNSFKLMQNFPNPFNPTTIISYILPNRTDVSLKVYDLLAREIAELVNQTQAAGRYEVRFDGSKIPSGIYFYKLEAGNYLETKKFILLK